MRLSGLARVAVLFIPVVFGVSYRDHRSTDEDAESCDDIYPAVTEFKVENKKRRRSSSTHRHTFAKDLAISEVQER